MKLLNSLKSFFFDEETIVSCDVCGAKLRVKNDKENPKLKCPKCKNIFIWHNTALQNKKISPPVVRRTLNGVCGKNDQVYKIIFAKKPKDSLFRFEKGQPINDNNLYEDSNLAINEQDQERFSQADFDWEGYKCLYCQKEIFPIHCTDCEHFICGSASYFGKNKEERGRCPICKTDFILVEDKGDYFGDSQNKAKKNLKESDASQLNEKNRLSLPTSKK